MAEARLVPDLWCGARFVKSFEYKYKLSSIGQEYVGKSRLVESKIRKHTVPQILRYCISDVPSDVSSSKHFLNQLTVSILRARQRLASVSTTMFETQLS